MAEHSEDREDLLREATAMPTRIEFKLSDETPVFVGFRRNGAGSLYIDQDPVYQFNVQLELRRAYVDDFLFKTEARQLVKLERMRHDGKPYFLRTELDDTATHEFLQRAVSDIDRIVTHLRDEAFQVLGQVPQDEGVLKRVTDWLGELPRPLLLANTPRVGQMKQRKS